ncbi:hypothetical protein ACIPR8_15380 [Stenotrophomonas sp. LARHCG68]
MSNVTKAKALMAKITYQLRPPETTTMAPCKNCGRSSPGGQSCADCLCTELETLIKNKGAVVRWSKSAKAAAEDEALILTYARRS